MRACSRRLAGATHTHLAGNVPAVVNFAAVDRVLHADAEPRLVHGHAHVEVGDERVRGGGVAGLERRLRLVEVVAERGDLAEVAGARLQPFQDANLERVGELAADDFAACLRSSSFAAAPTSVVACSSLTWPRGSRHG